MLLLVFAALIPFLAADCPPGSLAYQDKCFQFISTPATFLQAEESCISLNGHLTSVRNAFEGSFISSYSNFPTGDYWLGGSLLEGSNWTWIDLTSFNYSNWAAEQPYYGGCLAVSTANSFWSSTDCTLTRPYVCSVTPLPSAPSYSHQPPCGQYWYEKDINSCHFGTVSSMYTSFQDAELQCQQEGYHLASILSNEDKVYFARNFNKVGYVWFGLYRNDSNQDWSFTNGAPMFYTNWASGQPSNMAGPACVALDSGHAGQPWHVVSCDYSVKAWICRRPAFH